MKTCAVNQPTMVGKPALITSSQFHHEVLLFNQKQLSSKKDIKKLKIRTTTINFSYVCNSRQLSEVCSGRTQRRSTPYALPT